MKSKSIKSKTKKTRKNMINSKTLKSIKKYTYKNKGGATLFGKLASGIGKAASSVGKVAGKAAASAGKVTEKAAASAGKVTEKAASAGKDIAKKGAKTLSKKSKTQFINKKSKKPTDPKKSTDPKKPNKQYINKKTERYKNKKTNSLIMNNQSRNGKNTSLNETRKASYNKNSKSYICGETNFELILPPTHKPSPTVIGKKNMTYYKIPIPPATEAGSRIKFKKSPPPIPNIDHNAGKNPPNCPPKQRLESVNHLPTSGMNNQQTKVNPKSEETKQPNMQSNQQSNQQSNMQPIKPPKKKGIFSKVSSIRKSLPGVRGLARGTGQAFSDLGVGVASGVASMVFR